MIAVMLKRISPFLCGLIWMARRRIPPTPRGVVPPRAIAGTVGGGGTGHVLKESVSLWGISAFVGGSHRSSFGVTHLLFRNDVAAGEQTLKRLGGECNGSSGSAIGVRVENGLNAGQEGRDRQVGQIQGEGD